MKYITFKKQGNNLKAMLKDGYEVLGTFGQGIILGKGLHRVLFDMDKDEATYSYILNK